MPGTTENTITATMTLNEISLSVPRALEVFARHGLDSCCGGAKQLALVCERHGLDLDALLAELRAL
jgi:iron-sulfur cluster repair protein YtfE (RIC family)